MPASKSTSNVVEWKALLRPYIGSHRSESHKFSADKSALLIIDMQRFFLEDSSHAYVSGSERAVENAGRLVAEYRSRSLPVIFIRHALLEGEDPGAMGTWWADVLRDQDEMSQIVSVLKPQKNEDVMRKTRYSAFVGTDLESRLKELGAKQIVITGVMTHLCCETTARDAFMRDFDVFFVIDGTASKTEDLHVSSLKTLSDGFVIPVTTAEVLTWLRR